MPVILIGGFAGFLIACYALYRLKSRRRMPRSFERKPKQVNAEVVPITGGLTEEFHRAHVAELKKWRPYDANRR